jgi:alkanesulfonate monooxygenase SsuD/methylene tetrahydromethanopterin reductase-like flavin-dependent oxidoreductase (luciferase family)
MEVASSVVKPGMAFGVTAGLPPDGARALAAECERLGYSSLWSNDAPGAAGLKTLAHFAAGSARIDLGVGVLPLDQHPPERIRADIEKFGLDPARIILGVGSGQLRRQLGPMRDAVASLRELLPATRIVVAAMRRRMCLLGGEVADGVILNWMLPDSAAEARSWVHEGAASAVRPAPPVASYVRFAAGPAAVEKVTEEELKYRSIDEGSRRHFEALNAPVGSVGVAVTSRGEAREALRPYQAALDLVIARLPAGCDMESMQLAARAAAPHD